MSRETIYEASVEYFLTPIAELLNDASVTEVMVNGFDQIYVERRGKIEPTNARFESDAVGRKYTAEGNAGADQQYQRNEERPGAALDRRLVIGHAIRFLVRRCDPPVREWPRKRVICDSGDGSTSRSSSRFHSSRNTPCV